MEGGERGVQAERESEMPKYKGRQKRGRERRAQ